MTDLHNRYSVRNVIVANWITTLNVLNEPFQTFYSQFINDWSFGCFQSHVWEKV